MERINRESIAEILKMAGQKGLHVETLALHLINRYSDIFGKFVLEPRKVKTKVNRILLADVNKKSGSLFSRVPNPETGKYYKGRYRIK
ncbi:MAG: hypothetical protein LBT42_08410 [Tannerella sp.]|jgi:hypothetical protein|nr:hypothetical protein [Tannerella sp.]